MTFSAYYEAVKLILINKYKLTEPQAFDVVRRHCGEELGYLKVNKEGLVGDGRIINTRDMVFKTGERIWHLIAPATHW